MRACVYGEEGRKGGTRVKMWYMGEERVIVMQGNKIIEWDITRVRVFVRK